MDRIKTSYEIAMERTKRIKQVPKSEIDRMEYEQIGKKYAASYFRDKDFKLIEKVNNHSVNYRDYILTGIQDTLLNNIILPSDSDIQETNRKAMEGLFLIKNDKHSLSNIASQLEHIFRYYQQTLEHAYGDFRNSFAEKFNTRPGMEKTEPERHPSFKGEWLKLQGVISKQYNALLKEQKEKLRDLK